MRKRILTTIFVVGLLLLSVSALAYPYAKVPKKVNELPTEIKVGGVFPITARPDAGPDRRDGFLIAIAEINNQTGANRILPEGTTLVGNVQDDLNTAAGGTTAAENLLAWGAHIVLGSSGSSVSAAMASALTPTKVVQISYASSSPALSDRELYPYFMRVCASDADQGIAIAKLVKAFGWTRGAVIHTSDSYGTGLIEIFKENFNDTGTVLTDQSFEAGATDVSAQVQSLKDKDPEFIVGNFIDEDAKTVMKKASDLGMLDYVWISTDGWSTSATISDATVKTAMNYSIGSNPAPSAGTGLSDFNTTWFNSTWSYLETPGKSQTTGTAFNSYAPFSYDAVYVAAKGLAAAASVDGDDLLAALYDVTHEGATGTIEFNDLGEVIGRYDYVQLRGDTFVKFGEYAIPSGGGAATAILDNAAAFYLKDESEWSISGNVVTNVTEGIHGKVSPGFEILGLIFAMGILVITLKKRRK
ncbi:MAG: ABC transporter substrate-binding protein [Candidatus Hodarchaeales archaeon]